MSTLTITVTDTGATKEIGLVEYPVYDINVTGSRNFSRTTTVPEFHDWRRRNRLEEDSVSTTLDFDREVGNDLAPGEAKMEVLEVKRLLSQLALHMVDGGRLS